MDILFPVARISISRSSYLLCSFPLSHSSTSPLLPSDPSPPSSSLRTSCSRRSSQQPSDGSDNGDDKKDEKSSMDWDKAWSSFRKQGGKKRPSSSGFNADKYVSWNPRRSNYPLAEEVDPIKRAERSNLMLWTSPRFTLGVAIVIVTFLLVYTLLAPMM